MPLTDYVALVSLTSDIPTRTLLQVTAALQKQVTRDFGPIWGLPATIDAFDHLRTTCRLLVNHIVAHQIATGCREEPSGLAAEGHRRRSDSVCGQ